MLGFGLNGTKELPIHVKGPPSGNLADVNCKLVSDRVQSHWGLANHATCEAIRIDYGRALM